MINRKEAIRLQWPNFTGFQTPLYTPTNATTRQFATHARLFSIVFLLILATLHWLEPEVDPIWRLVSEYELGKWGWMMRTAYVAWGGSLLFVSLASWKLLTNTRGNFGKWWLIMLSLALFGAGIFVTQPFFQAPATLTHFFHIVCSTLIIFTFPLTSMLVTTGLLAHEEFKTYSRPLVITTLLGWLGLAAFFITLTLFQQAIRNGSSDAPVWIGIANRFMVVCYISWIMVVASILRRTHPVIP